MVQQRDRQTDEGDRTGRDRPEPAEAGGTVVADPDRVRVGDTITVRGADLPPSRELELHWETVEGGWETVRKNRVAGVDFDARTVRIAEVRTDEAGRAEATWTVPEDFGGDHAVTVRTPAGDTVAACGVSLVPRFELDRTRAPLGAAFRLTGYGLGPPDLRNNYRVVWDGGAVGYVTGLGNRGTASATVRAVGPPGEHVLRVGPLHRGGSFLDADSRSRFDSVAGEGEDAWTVSVTEPERRPPAAWMESPRAEEPVPEHYPALDRATDATLAATPSHGQAGTTTTIEGEGFPPGTTVDLVWHRHSGRRMEGIPITPEPVPDLLPAVTADEDGAFRTEVTVPRDLGGTRPITAEVDGESVAVTGFVVQPDVLDVSPTEAPVGTEIEIELTGAGWTEFDNSLHFVYDNRPLGYVCGGAGRSGVENPGTATAVLPATGEPGLHFVDVYPNVFDIEADAPDFVNVPHLSHRHNHPVRPLPALHYTVDVTG